MIAATDCRTIPSDESGSTNNTGMLPEFLCRESPLSAVDERRLFQQLRETRRQAESACRTRRIEALRNQIVVANLRLLVSIAARFTSANRTIAEAVSDGYAPLIRAAELFDPSRGNRFSTYASHAIWNHLARTGKRDAARRSRESTTAPEILAGIVGDTQENNKLLREREQIARRPEDVLRPVLTERETRMVAARFGLGEFAREHAFREIAEMMGLSRERVRVLTQRALQKLRENLQIGDEVAASATNAIQQSHDVRFPGGHEVLRLVRSDADGADDRVLWKPSDGEINREALEGFDAVVHLAGANIGDKRWTEQRKTLIRGSRVDGTRLLAQTLAELSVPPKVLVCASAIGYYGDRGDEELDESSAPGEGFLPEVCAEWEAAADAARDKGIRVVHTRFGVILNPEGGALKKMLLPFKLGVGGVIGSGKQYWSWVGIDDVIGSILHAITNDAVSGPVNVTAPNPVTNREFTKTLGRVLRRPTIFPMPAFAARIALGEMADDLSLVLPLGPVIVTFPGTMVLLTTKSRELQLPLVPPRTAVVATAGRRVFQTEIPASFVKRILSVVLTLSACLGAGSPQQSISAAEPTPKPRKPKIAGPSREGMLAISGLRLPDGMRAELVAAEPLLANPVAFCIDEQGRFYVCETFRQQKGVEDNRSHMTWLHDDLAAQTVADRLKYFRKHLGKKVKSYTEQDDRIRMLTDTNGDGRLDKATVFASGFNSIVEGTGAGVLAYRGNVYYTCIPKLWKLRDSDGDGVADDRTALHDGYGVRVAFRGHDMHGLTIGPDGRLYFSIGDRGYNVVTKEGKRLKRPGTGAVFRCELDGSKLEVFAYGLRNPQELAFDDYGNLFTGDNNCDSGDRARWVYVVQGGDTGWRMYYQYLKDRGPWNREMIWYPHDTPALSRKGPGNVAAGSVAARKQPAYIIPPVANLADGPSGLTHYPGVGLPPRYKGHFFMCDFRGNAGRSGIRSFAVKPKGAGFELTDSHQFVWKILATDVDFGYDGNMYATDWVSGWNGPGKGRIYRFRHSVNAKPGDGAQLIRKGFTELKPERLVTLLEHPDRRIRLEAQFELATRDNATSLFSNVARNSQKPELARIHAIWGLGQLIRKGNAKAASRLSSLLYRQDSEILAQAVRTFGDSIDFSNPAFHRCLKIGGSGRVRMLLLHRNSRVRSLAAIASGSIRDARALPALTKVLIENGDRDPILRHAAVMGLLGILRKDLATLEILSKHSNRSVRMGALLVARRIAREQFRAFEDTPNATTSVNFSSAAMRVAQFFDDTEPTIVLEAARVFDELETPEAMQRLARLAGRPGLSPPLLRRVLNANLRAGKTDNVAAVARIAANSRLPEAIRLEAIECLNRWNAPPKLDRVTGAWRPIENRKKLEGLAAILRPHLGGMFSGSNQLRQQSAKLAAAHGVKAVGPLLFRMLGDAGQPGPVRAAALRALGQLKSRQLSAATQLALKSDDPELRAEGRRAFAELEPQKVVPLLDAAIRSGADIEKQSAIQILPTLKSKSADELLAKWLQLLVDRKVPPEIQLDLIEAAKTRRGGRLKQLVDRFEESRDRNDPLAQFRESLAGGSAERGRDIFFGRTAVSCRRCHKINDSGGDVGPDLSKIGSDKKRDYLLESLVLPNKSIAKGFESVTLAMDDGKVYSGIVKADDGKTIQLMQATGEIVTLKKDAIDDRAKGKSAMPDDLVKHLSKHDLRDLVEFLASQKKKGVANPAGGE
eukprot:g8289.t1